MMPEDIIHAFNVEKGSRRPRVIGLIRVRFEKLRKTPHEAISSTEGREEYSHPASITGDETGSCIRSCQKYKEIQEVSKEGIKKISLYLYKCSLTTTLGGSLHMIALHMIAKAQMEFLRKNKNVQVICIQ